MSKRRPSCGSYDTGVCLMNHSGRLIVNTGRAVLTVGAAVVGGLFNYAAAHVGAHNTWKATDPGKLKGYQCNRCGREFSV